MGNIKTIAGVDFEAVRFNRPKPHWRVKVIKTGYLYDSGCFNNESRPKMWESVEYTAQRIGAERFAQQAMEAK